MKKANCWEVQRCGREPGGANAADRKPCPAATETVLDGVHGGRNAGRACWVVAGTFCGGEIVGSTAKRIGSCRECAFYKMVALEEGGALLPSDNLVRRLHHALRFD